MMKKMRSTGNRLYGMRQNHAIMIFTANASYNLFLSISQVVLHRQSSGIAGADQLSDIMTLFE